MIFRSRTLCSNLLLLAVTAALGLGVTAASAQDSMSADHMTAAPMKSDTAKGGAMKADHMGAKPKAKTTPGTNDPTTLGGADGGTGTIVSACGDMGRPWCWGKRNP